MRHKVKRTFVIIETNKDEARYIDAHDRLPISSSLFLIYRQSLSQETPAAGLPPTHRITNLSHCFHANIKYFSYLATLITLRYGQFCAFS